MSELPQGWIETTLGDLATRLVDGSHTPPPKQASGLPMLSARNVQNGEILFDEYRLISEESFINENARTRISSGDILLTIVGALGRTAVVPVGISQFTLQRSVAVVRPLEVILPEFLKYFFDSPDFQTWIVDNAKGTAQRGIYLKKLASSRVLVAPLPEQRRIVAKLDSMLARTRLAREELARIPALVAHYKQAILGAAFRGELCQENAESWRRCQLQEVAELQLGKMLDKAKNKGQPFPYLRNVNVRWFQFDLDDLLLMRFTPSEEDKFSIHDGDILVCEGGEPGRAAIWRNGQSAIKYQKALHRIIPSNAIIPEWIVYQLYYLSKSGRLEAYFTGTTIKHLPKQVLEKIEFLVPPVAVQIQLVGLIEAAFSHIDRIAEEHAKAIVLLDQLDQATLAKAFRGELVPQNPNDEPASVLLKRIRAERGSGPKPERKRRARATAEVQK